MYTQSWKKNLKKFAADVGIILAAVAVAVAIVMLYGNAGYTLEP